MMRADKRPALGLPLAVLQGHQCAAWRELVGFVHLEPERRDDEAHGVLARGIAPLWVRGQIVPARLALGAFGPGALALWLERCPALPPVYWRGGPPRGW